MNLPLKFFATTCLILFVFFLLACHAPEAKINLKDVAAVTTPNDKYVIDTTESAVTYNGSMVIATNGGHTGHVYLSMGELFVGNGKLVGGTVVVNMNTITDIKAGSDNDLIRHLKSPDFFDVKKFPTAGFAIVMAVPVNDSTLNVTGNLTIKDITLPVTFPANIKIKDGLMLAHGNMVIDRTRWGVIYDSGKFFLNIADHAISDEIRFEIKIVARRIELGKKC